ncbi:CAP domain-containing protein [Candidatus Nomurabacteria bacterium]|nr:CAP domain-containing protein [Candidatus Nomurabacteria bacterium]
MRKAAKRPANSSKAKKRVVRRKAHLAIVPQPKNSYRPHLVRRQGLAFILAFVFSLQIVYNYAQTGSVLGQATDISRQRLLVATNQERLSTGAQKLQSNQLLNSAAEAKANDMLSRQYWSHTSPDGATPWAWVKSSGYLYTRAGENLAKGFHTSKGVVTAWMNSPEHRENMLDGEFSDVGFAVKKGELDGKMTTLIVALYGKPAAGTAAATTASVLAASDQPYGFVSRLGVGVQSMTPALVGSIVLMLFSTGVALIAHANRNKLPKPLRQSWYRYHGLYKAAGMTSIIIILIALYGGGQI